MSLSKILAGIKKEDLHKIFVKPNWCPKNKELIFSCYECEYFQEKKIISCQFKFKETLTD